MSEDLATEGSLEFRTGSFDKPLQANNSRAILEGKLQDRDLMTARNWLKACAKPGKDENRSDYFSEDLTYYWHFYDHLCFSTEGG